MASTSTASPFASLPLDQVLEDLSSRFIVNLPAEELESIERICFQIEQAHWYYEDFVRPQASHLPSFSLRKFSEIVFSTNPLLADYNAISAYDDFLRYKERVPVCGAILLSDTWDKCLLVRGWKSGASWSFPRGKINQGELERDCCVREVWEETGYDISPHFNPNVRPHNVDSSTCPPPLPEGVYTEDDYIEVMMKEQRIRLYVIPQVSENTLFETKTRKEISKIAWAHLSDLPTWSKKNKANKKDIKCYMVTPFVGPLKHWISEERKRLKSGVARRVLLSQPMQQTVPQEVYRGRALSPPRQEHSAGAGSDEEDLAERSRQLQALFFGSDAPANPATPPVARYEPIAQPAAKSPKVGSDISAFSAVVPPAASANETDSKADNLLRLLQQAPPPPSSTSKQQPQSAHNGTLPAPAPPAAVPRAGTAGAPRTGRAISFASPALEHRPQPQSDARSGMKQHKADRSASQSSSSPMVVRKAPAASLTELERQNARNDLLAELAAELGSGFAPQAIVPAGPAGQAAQYGGRESGQDQENEDDDDEELDCASPAQDLLAIFQSQMQVEGNGRQIGEMKLTNAAMQRWEEDQARKRLLEEQRLQRILREADADAQVGGQSRYPQMVPMHPAQQAHPQQAHRSPQHILQILNGGRGNGLHLHGGELGIGEPAQHPGHNQNGYEQGGSPMTQHVSRVEQHYGGSAPYQYGYPPSGEPGASQLQANPKASALLSLFNAGATNSQLAPALHDVRSAHAPAPQSQPYLPTQYSAPPLAPYNTQSHYQYHHHHQQQQQQQPTFPPEFANGDRLREFSELLAQDQQQQATRQNGPQAPHQGGAPNDLSRLFASAARL